MGAEYDAVKAILNTFDTLETLTGLPLKMPRRIFTPPNDQKYLEIIRLPNDLARTWGPEKMFRGIVRVGLHWPLDDLGEFPALQVCEQIAEAIPKGFVMEYGAARLIISDVPNIGQPLDSGQETIFPVSFTYHS